ncbi:MAG: hypothetical protein ABEJ88_10000 [Halobacterium sp.]
MFGSRIIESRERKALLVALGLAAGAVAAVATDIPVAAVMALAFVAILLEDRVLGED